MIRNMHQSLKQQSKLIALLAVGFVLSALVGMAIAKWGPESIASWVTVEDTAGNEQIESIFGRFRESVRDGELGAISTCILIVFGINTVASIMLSISTVFILPLAFLFQDGCVIGASLLSLPKRQI